MRLLGPGAPVLAITDDQQALQFPLAIEGEQPIQPGLSLHGPFRRCAFTSQGAAEPDFDLLIGNLGHFRLETHDRRILGPDGKDIVAVVREHGGELAACLCGDGVLRAQFKPGWSKRFELFRRQERAFKDRAMIGRLAILYRPSSNGQTSRSIGPQARAAIRIQGSRHLAFGQVPSFAQRHLQEADEFTHILFTAGHESAIEAADPLSIRHEDMNTDRPVLVKPAPFQAQLALSICSGQGRGTGFGPRVFVYPEVNGHGHEVLANDLDDLRIRQGPRPEPKGSSSAAFEGILIEGPDQNGTVLHPGSVAGFNQ